MNGDSLIVTSPTGVDVELAIAGAGSRAYAFIIDWHIRLLLALAWLAAISLVVSKLLHPKSPVTIAFLAVPAPLIYFLYHPVLELTMRGRTPGKRIAGVRIVNRQGGTPSSLAILIRNAFRLIDCLPILYALGLCTTIFNPQRLRFGDMAAGTLLVHDGTKESEALSQLGSLSLNPALDPTIAVLGNDLLLRWQELEPPARQHLARELLARIVPQGTDPPPPASPETLDDHALQRRVRKALSAG